MSHERSDIAGAESFLLARRQHVRHRYARRCRPAGVEGHSSVHCRRGITFPSPSTPALQAGGWLRSGATTSDTDPQPFSVPPNYRAGSVHSKGNFPYRQTRLCEIAKALIFVFRPRDAAAHFLALKPSSTSRRMASARVGRSLCFAAHASNALSGLGCKRTTTCTPGLELRGFGASTNCILIN